MAGTVALSALLSACGTSSVIAPLGRATTQDNVAASSQGLHRVIDGDSLYSVAWRYGVDYRDLSRWNAIPEPYTIRPAQLLRVSRPAVLPPMPTSAATDAAAVPALESARSDTAPQVQERAESKPASRAQSSTPPPSSTTPTKTAPVAIAATASEQQIVRNWRWPVKGKIVGSFGKAGGKGIDIAGSRGTAVESAAAGHVVYSGSGLRGYGQLIIVKHNKRYLSAYAHNDRLHVKEGDTVQGGQRIAEMGDSGAKSVRLHFEIRRDGMPVDPTRFLPR